MNGMQVYYAPDIIGDSYSLSESESRHSVRVLRMKKGEPVNLIDGKGNLYHGLITDADPAECRIKVESVTPGFEKRDYYLHIAISPLKNPERFEWFVEKAVEIGVDQITPVICKNTEKPGIKSERIRNLIISAMKQSIKAYDTILSQTVTLGEFLNMKHRGITMIAHCHKELKRYGIKEAYTAGKDAVILIGPEGDFSKEEIEKAMSKNFTHIHLGSSRMRTETAGIAACHSVFLINQ